MRNRWSKFVTLAAGLLSACTWLVPMAPAQEKSDQKTQKAVVTKATKSRGMGQDPNIKHKSDVNDPNHRVPPPADKADAATPAR
jgi:hypothetical protein